MGFMAKKLYQLEQKNNLRILALLEAQLSPLIKAQMGDDVPCGEGAPDHCGIRITFPTGEYMDLHRCRQRWFFDAPGYSRRPAPMWHPTNIESAASNIASTLNSVNGP